MSDGMKTRFQATVLCAVIASALLPIRAAGQYFEPHARRPGVAVPQVAGQSLGEVLGHEPSVAAPRLVEGTYPVLVIPALFSDSPEPDLTANQIQDAQFADAGRSVATYYADVSDGRLTVDGQVASWTRTSVPVVEAAGDLNGHGWIGERAQEHFRAAIAAVDDEIDFGQFDNDGPDGVPNSGDDNGVVDAIVFMNLEVAGSCGGPGFWPHFGGLQTESGEYGVPTADVTPSGEPIVVASYIADSAVDCAGDLQGPAVLAHEFGHLIGLPDFYRRPGGIEPEERHWAIGCFGIMGAGAWGCGSGALPDQFGPTEPSPWSKALLGWIELEEVGQVTDQEYVLEPIQTSNRALKVPLSPNTGEYFLIEYRPRLGWDEPLPDDGVLIYHVDESADVVGADLPVPNYRHQLLEADGDSALRKVEADGGNRGVAADMFARNGTVSEVGRLGAPSTAHHGGLPATLDIHSIQVENGVARIRLSTTTELTVTGPRRSLGEGLSDYITLFGVSGGTPPYFVKEPPGGLGVDSLTLSIPNGDNVWVHGPLLDGGIKHIPISIQDSDGASWFTVLELNVSDPALSDLQLMTQFSNAVNLTTHTQLYLDNAGNENGRYDVGDLRAYLIRTGVIEVP